MFGIATKTEYVSDFEVYVSVLLAFSFPFLFLPLEFLWLDAPIFTSAFTADNISEAFL